MLLVEQNASARARPRRPRLRARDRPRRDVGHRRGDRRRTTRPSDVLPRVLEASAHGTASSNRSLSGLATGGIYASVALALVMIYQATDLVNFAQGEMAMFSTYIAWR